MFLTKHEGVEHDESDKIHIPITAKTICIAADAGRTVVCLPRLSLRHVQDKTGVPIRAIDRLEIGKGDIRWGYLLLLLNYYEMTIDFAALLGDENSSDHETDV